MTTKGSEGDPMEALRAARVVHYYDTRLRETLCGRRGVEHLSTRFARAVTCPACAGLLHERLTPSGGAAPIKHGDATVKA